MSEQCVCVCVCMPSFSSLQFKGDARVHGSVISLVVGHSLREPILIDMKWQNQVSERSTRQVVHSRRVTFLFLLQSHDLKTHTVKYIVISRHETGIKMKQLEKHMHLFILQKSHANDMLLYIHRQSDGIKTQNGMKSYDIKTQNQLHWGTSASTGLQFTLQQGTSSVCVNPQAAGDTVGNKHYHCEEWLDIDTASPTPTKPVISDWQINGGLGLSRDSGERGRDGRMKE